MKMFRRPFLLYLLLLLALAVFANWPRNGGSLKTDFVWAGFPWTFGFWESGNLVRFDVSVLFTDLVIGLVLAVGVAYLCASSREIVIPETLGNLK